MRPLVPTFALALAVPLLIAGPATSAPAVAPESPSDSSRSAATKPLRITVLSNRADLVSGGDALVRVAVPRGVRPRTIRVFVNGERARSVRARKGRVVMGRLTGLRVGTNRVVAKAPGRRGRTTITNHPNGGPVFSGPQHGPYVCQDSARDAQCNEPSRISWLYKSVNPAKQGLQPYDRSNPPADVATTTTDRGTTVPFVVRREDGFQARDRYSILQLWQPGKRWRPWAPQRQWNRKLLVTHGGNCGASYTPGEPRLEDYAGTVPVPTGQEQSYVTALGKGFAVAATALNNAGHNCSVTREAESVMMVKERLVERYGTLRFTIGTGCSGGSIAQHTIANAYPGIYQGLITTCSYPDVLTAGAQFTDYHLMRLYFEDPTRWAPGVVWTPLQMGMVEGHASHLNAVTADEGLYKTALNPESACPGTRAPVPGDRTTRFDSETNPGGVRCSALDMMTNQLGVRGQAVWSEGEQAAGHGFTGLPLSNEGILYGLNQLRAGLITPGMFVDLNVKVGGLDINSDFVPERITGDAEAIRRSYRTGLVNPMDHMDEVAIINHGGPDPGIAHDYAHAFWTAHRLQEDQGHTDNRVMWFGATPLIGDVTWANDALLAMDRWLTEVARDRTSAPLAAKVVAARDRAGVTDRCLGPTAGLVEGQCLTPELETNLSTPRQEAGGPEANDVMACRLKPLTRTDFDFMPVPFTNAQWARLEAVFASGVCDWTRPGRGQGPTTTWLEYGDATTPTYGGAALPVRPTRSGNGWMAPSFRELWRVGR